MVGLPTTALALLFALLPPDETDRPALRVVMIVGGCLAVVLPGRLFYLSGRRRA